MKKMLIIVVIFSTIIGPMGAESITLNADQAVEMALARNLDLKQTGIDLKTDKRSKDNAWNLFLPSMSISAGFTMSSNIFEYEHTDPLHINEPGAHGFATRLSLSLPLNAAIPASIRNLIAKYEAGLLNYENAQKRLERDVRKQFYLLLGSQENIRIQQANIDLATKRHEQARTNFENGLVTELDVLSAEVTVANLRPAYNRELAFYENLVLFFKFLLGLDRNEEIALDGSLETVLYTFDSEALIAKYINGRLDLRSLEKQIESYKYAKKSALRNFNTPALNLSYRFDITGSNNDSIGFFPKKDIAPWTDWGDRGTLSLGLQWKLDGLIPGSSASNQLRQLQDGIDSLEIAKEMAFQNAGIEITNLINSLDTARKTIEANTSGVELAKRNLQLTEEAYNAGSRQRLDVESAQNEFLLASQQLLFAKYEYIAGLLDLEYALNTSRDEFVE